MPHGVGEAPDRWPSDDALADLPNTGVPLLCGAEKRLSFVDRRLGDRKHRRRLADREHEGGADLEDLESLRRRVVRAPALGQLPPPLAADLGGGQRERELIARFDALAHGVPLGVGARPPDRKRRTESDGHEVLGGEKCPETSTIQEPSLE
ncbi:MAG: hypothetical protein JNK60_03480 [Acidobacteria bacterium]|nr:hypothetical protein [Acidobacteriota bacterium]